ncbi:hypothetical protein DER45DRAFT_596185 [Fusarium avenaceum]|nr:hypothetical protein DER45DRAFT_596185 [Fusarium avenaceum]
MVNISKTFFTYLAIGFAGSCSAIFDQRSDYSALGMYEIVHETIFSLFRNKEESAPCVLSASTDSNGEYVNGYAYFVTTISFDCKETFEKEAIQEAVEKCADYLKANAALSGCCKSSQKGGWAGQVRMTSQPSKYPAHEVEC